MVPFLTFPHEKTTIQWPKVGVYLYFKVVLDFRFVQYGLINNFWPLESGFLMRKSEKKGPLLFRPSGPNF